MSFPICTLVGIIFLTCSAISTVNGTNDDTLHCTTFQRKLRLAYGSQAERSPWFPKCLPGGYWLHVQCSMKKCYCAYVDTGMIIRDTQNRNISSRDDLLSFLKRECPMISKVMPDLCESPPSNYPCKYENTRRYYYDSSTDTCRAHSRSCLGFETYSSCENSCVKKKMDRCNFEVNSGRTCDRRNPGLRWYHDEDKNNCRPFRYQGCGGNENNYKEKWLCLKTCEPMSEKELIIQVQSTKYLVKLPTWVVIEKHLVPSANNKLTMEEFKEIESDFNEISKLPSERGQPTTEPLVWPELANKNMSRAEICALPSEQGNCRAFFPRWYFDGSKGKCVKFIYGGCKGNGNNFQYPKQCERFCNAKVPPSKAEMLLEQLETSKNE